MKLYSLRSLETMRFLMVILNLIMIIFYGASVLLATNYIIDNHMARDFLDQISYIPRHPLLIFFGSILFYSILVYLIYHRSEIIINNEKYNFWYNVLEIVVCLIVIYLLNMCYNGILLLIFCDCMYYFKQKIYPQKLLFVYIVLYFISFYNFISLFNPMMNLQEYFYVYDANLKNALLLSQNILETINIILFILFMMILITKQVQENERISQELLMIHQVNRNLQNYAAITEKIGENNERKRLAREIHDTLGHALTGIAAGIDACIAMIDMNPKATKQQLFLISKVVRQGITDVRNSLNKLRPGALEEHSFKVAVEKMIEEFSSVSDVSIDFCYELENIDFENTKEDILFRIIQESMTNALRHGKANHIDIHFYQQEHQIILKIKDNGEGCPDIHYGYGLKQMEERVSIIHGTVSFDGHDGFTTIVTIPLQKGEIYDTCSHC